MSLKKITLGLSAMQLEMQTLTKLGEPRGSPHLSGFLHTDAKCSVSSDWMTSEPRICEDWQRPPLNAPESMASALWLCAQVRLQVGPKHLKIRSKQICKS